MKIGKWAKLTITTICVMCMVLNPMCVYAVDAGTGDTEKTTESEINTEVTPEANITQEAEVTSEADITPGAEVTPKAEVSPQPVRMLLMGAAPVNDEINIGDYSGGIVINSENVSEYNGKTITGSAGQQANLVVDGVEVELTIKNLTIDRAQEGSNNYNCDAIYLINGAKLILTLEGNNKLVGSNDNGGAGIRVEDGNTLIITENSSGTLEAVGGNGHGGAAGIGAGNCGYDGTHTNRTPVLGTIEICGGTINASGGTSYHFLNEVLGCAGIGCSAMCESGRGSITVSGGNVTATGGYEGAGIGGASICSPNNITINGGVIIANAGQYAAAIGSGCNSGFETIQMGSISITGGKVTANGNIGYGNCITSGAKIEGGSVEIKDNAIVTVTEGEINPKTDIEQGHVTQRYSLTLTVMNPSYTTGTKTGHITIGVGENVFVKDIIYDLEGGKAVANIEIETVLYGEQPVMASIEGTELEEKTLIIGSETELIYGSEAQDYSVSANGEVGIRYENGVLTISGNGSATVSMSDGVEKTTDSIVVADEAYIELTLNNLNVDTTGKNRSPIVIGHEAKCKIISVGSNTLKRCDSQLAVGVIEASNGSELTIGGYGTLNLQGKIGKGTNDKDKYAGGIRAIDAEVIIDDNPTLIISNPEGDAFSGILSEKITINGGNINSSVSGSSQGIGIPYDSTNFVHDVIIKGGTVYAEGGDSANWLGAITNPNCTRAVITGGSVNMNKRSKTDDGRIDDMKNNQPVNDENEKLYCTTITVGKADDNGKYTLSKNAKVESLTIKDKNGNDYDYGIDHMYTDKDAKLYLWLPEGAKVSKVETESGEYEGECTTNTNNTYDYKGNSFGTKEATFALESGSEYTLIMTGKGTKDNPYKLSTREELEKFRELVNSGDTKICGVLTTNIDINESNKWIPIGTEDHPYQGTFDGCGKKIDRLRIPASNSDYNNKGFFGVVDNACIKNLTITGYVGQDKYTAEDAVNYGMFAGKASNSTFEGCINNGNVYGGQNAAGICGWASHCTFKKCTNDGGATNGVSIGSYKTVCGIVYDADNSCTVENCVNSMHGNSKFCKMKESADMSDCYTIGGKNHINCLSLAAKYDYYDFVEEDADYYGHSRSGNENYAAYKADGTKVTDNWRDGTIAYLLQGNQNELIWINRLGTYKNEWPEINYTSDDACYRVYEVKTYAKCDKSDTPTLTYQNESGEDIVPTHSFTKEDKSSKAVKTPGTCIENAVYYYSCEHCGAVEKKDSHTFDGDVNPTNHVGETEIRGAKEAVHKTQTDGYTGDTYCSSCNTKISGGTAIKPASHEPSDWKHDETYHWKECTVEGCGTVIAGTQEAHSSTGTNKATCQKTAVCDKCGVEYGVKISCSYTAKVKSEAALKTPATETVDAVYYYSCSMCGKVEKDDMHTFVDYREPEEKPSSDDNSSSNNGQNQSDSSSSNSGQNQANNLSMNAGNNVPSNAGQVPTNNSSTNSKPSLVDNTVVNDEEPSSNETETTAKEEDSQINNEVIDETSKNIENDINDKGGSSVTMEEPDTIIDKEKASDQRPIVATVVATGSITAGTGAFFFLKRKRILEIIMKNLFKK